MLRSRKPVSRREKSQSGSSAKSSKRFLKGGWMSLQSEQLTSPTWRRVTILLGSGLVTVGVTAALTYGYLGLQKYRREQAEWSTIQALAKAEDFDRCLQQSDTVSPKSRYFTATQSLAEQCRLGKAKQLAAEEDWLAAIATAVAIPNTNQTAREEAQPLIQDWSNQVTQQGEALFQSGKLAEAIAMLRTLSAEAPQAAEVETRIKTWQTDWQKSEAAVKEAKALLNRGQWLAAKNTLEKVAAVKFWQDQSKPLLKQANDGIAAVEQYEAEVAADRQRAIAAASSGSYAAPYAGEAASSLAPQAPAYGEEAATPPPSYSAPAPLASVPSAAPAPAAAASGNFNQQVESLYQDYRNQGQGTWDAWTQACQDLGGAIVDQGPEASCSH